jgi:hypothetical protein
MNKIEKNIDAVKMMRDIRDKIRKKYENHPEMREKDLARIRKKYNFNRKKITAA